MASPGVSSDVLARIRRLGRELSTTTALLHVKQAEALGLSDTDHKCLDLAVRAEESLTAGQIARLSGLSTGAVTGVLDRLEGRGLVRRARDPEDRRKVLVEVADSDEPRSGRLARHTDDLTGRVLAGFTPDELDVIERYTTATLDEYRRLLAMHD